MIYSDTFQYLRRKPRSHVIMGGWMSSKCAIAVTVLLLTLTYPTRPVLSAAVAPCSHSDGKTSNGTSGDDCAPLKHVCLEEATCMNGTCQCPVGTTGDGRIACVFNESFTSMITGDPVLKTLDGIKTHVSFPCRYLLTHIMTTHERGMLGGTCEFKIYGLNYFINMGYYVLGVDLELKLTDNSDPDNIGMVAIRVQGIEDHDGNFKYVEYGKSGSLSKRASWSHPASLTFIDIVVESNIDYVNNIAILDVPECGLSLRFRAFVRHSRQLSGIFMGIKDKSGLVFLDDDLALMSTPFNFEQSRLAELKDDLDLSLSEAALYQALNQDNRQDFGLGAIPCTIASKQFTKVCLTVQDQAFAMRMCSFLYLEKSIAGCLLSDVFGESIGSMFGLCVQAMCWRHSWLCNDLKDTLMCYQCDGVPSYFLNLDCEAINEAILTYYPNPL